MCTAQLLSDLDQLGMDYVDLILLHGPNLKANHLGACDATACAANVAQWKAFVEMQVCDIYPLTNTDRCMLGQRRVLHNLPH